MFEHVELVEEARTSLPEAQLITRNGRVLEIRKMRSKVSVVADRSTFDGSKFIRLLDESFPDLGGPELEALRKVCHSADRSGEFFLCFNVTDQLVRTVIGHEKLCSKAWIEANKRCQLISDISIHSNVVPYNSYWSKLWALIRDEKSMTVQFPSFMLKEACEEGKTLKSKMLEWRSTGKSCEIGKNGFGGGPVENESGGGGPVENELGEGPVENELGGGGPVENELGGSRDENCELLRSPKLFWEIQAADVEHVKDLRRGSTDIKLVKWRGGKFVQKIDQNRIDSELEFVKKFSHPHIVYSFGEPCDGLGSSYFMEYMPSNLSHFIRERVNRGKVPPFPQHESLEVLLQIAKAMGYMHQENVVHCDLKCDNILISEIFTLDDVKHYLVKVADFGSARLNSSDFIAGPGTTLYSAPEALEQREAFRHRKDYNVVIGEPDKIDVYSFGIVAFEVLTGEDNYFKLCKRSSSTFRKGVIEGNVRPLLDKKYIQNEELISLIMRCWDMNPSKRPRFVEICKELNGFMRQEHQISAHSKNHKRLPGVDTLLARFKRIRIFN